MKFYALYFLDAKTQQTAKDQLFQRAKKFDFYFVAVPHPVDLPTTLKRQNVGLIRWGFYCIGRSDSDYTLQQLQNNISDLFFYQELTIDGELTTWFQQHCNVKKFEVPNPRTGTRRLVIKVTTVPADTERSTQEALETYKRDIDPPVNAYKFYEKEFIARTDHLLERMIDLLIQLQDDYNKKIQSRYESYWYNKRKGFDFMYNMLKEDIIPDLALEYIAYTETLLNKTTRTAMDIAQPLIIEAEKQCPNVWNPDRYGYERPNFERTKQFLIFLLRKKLKDTGVEFVFETPDQYISYLNLNFYIDPQPRNQQLVPPVPAKKPRIVYPPNFKK